MDSERKRQFKDEIFGQFARIGRAVSSGRRLELLDLLAQGERSVEELARESEMSVANTSQHLQVLRRARLVDSRQEGTYVYYRLSDDEVFHLWQSLRNFGEKKLAEIDHIVRDYLNRRDELEPVNMPDLAERLRDGRVLLLDVRPRQEFEAGHIAGARSVPLDELAQAEIDPGTEVVAYCRGPYCVYAHEAVEWLRREGHDARRLHLGYPDWRAAGLPTRDGDGK